MGNSLGDSLCNIDAPKWVRLGELSRNFAQAAVKSGILQGLRQELLRARLLDRLGRAALEGEISACVDLFTLRDSYDPRTETGFRDAAAHFYLNAAEVTAHAQGFLKGPRLGALISATGLCKDYGDAFIQRISREHTHWDLRRKTGP